MVKLRGASKQSLVGRRAVTNDEVEVILRMDPGGVKNVLVSTFTEEMPLMTSLRLAAFYLFFCVLLPAFSSVLQTRADEIFHEANAFDDAGGWKLDTQFIRQMNSRYLLAHGLGEPVDDAKNQTPVNEETEYLVWVRELDRVSKFDGQAVPGKFQLMIAGKPLETAFGAEGKNWHDGGTVSLSAGNHEFRCMI